MRNHPQRAGIVAFTSTLVVLLGGSARAGPPDPVDQILARITQAGGEAERESPVRTINVDIEAWKGEGFEPKTPNAESIEPGLVALEELAAEPCIELSLEGSGIDDKSLRHIKNLTGLRALSISNTMISDAGFVQLKDLKSLRRLAIYENSKITCSGLLELKELPRLCNLELNMCTLTDDGMAAVGALKHLTQLEISQCHTEDEVKLGHLRNLSELRTLTLFYSGVSDLDLGALADLEHLTTLWITESLDDKRLAQLGTLRRLDRLVLGIDGETNADSFNPLGNLSKLTTLVLDVRHIDDRSLGFLSRLTELYSLEIYGEKVSDTGLEPLMKLQKLKTVKLYDTSVTVAGAKKLKGSIPPGFVSVELIFR